MRTEQKVQLNRVRHAAHRAGAQVVGMRDGHYVVTTRDGAILHMDSNLDRIERYVTKRAAKDVRRLSDSELLKAALEMADANGIKAVGPTGETLPLSQAIDALMTAVRHDVRRAAQG